MNSQFIYLRFKKEEKHPTSGFKTEVERVMQIGLSAKQRISIDVGVENKYKIEKWIQILYDLIRYHVKVFSSISLV